MAGTQRARIGAAVLVCIAVGLFVAAFCSYIYHWGGDVTNYSFWARRWMVTIGLVLVGIVVRIVLAQNKTSRRGPR